MDKFQKRSWKVTTVCAVGPIFCKQYLRHYLRQLMTGRSHKGRVGRKKAEGKLCYEDPDYHVGVALKV